jgi:hypothetical protein
MACTSDASTTPPEDFENPDFDEEKEMQYMSEFEALCSKSPRDVDDYDTKDYYSVWRTLCHEAHSDGDLRLISRVMELLGVPHHAVLPMALCRHFDVTPHDAENAVRPFLRTLWLLRAGEYADEDIESILAYASSYFQVLRVAAQRAGKILTSLKRCMHTLVVLVYIADLYVVDRHFPVAVWRRYAGIDLNRKSVMGIISKLQFALGIPPAELLSRIDFIQLSDDEAAAQGLEVVAAIEALASSHRASRE